MLTLPTHTKTGDYGAVVASSHLSPSREASVSWNVVLVSEECFMVFSRELVLTYLQRSGQFIENYTFYRASRPHLKLHHVRSSALWCFVGTGRWCQISDTTLRHDKSEDSWGQDCQILIRFVNTENPSQYSLLPPTICGMLPFLCFRNWGCVDVSDQIEILMLAKSWYLDAYTRHI